MPILSAIGVFTHILHKCNKERSNILIARLCDCMFKFGLEAHKSLGNLLTPMSMEAGGMFDVRKALDKMTSYNDCSWNSLIVEYVKCGKFQQALFMYQGVQAAPLHLNEYALAALLKACGELTEVQRGYEIHNEIIVTGLLDCDIFVGNTLMDMYVKFGFLAEARVVFNALPFHDVVSWNILIKGYVKHESGEEALSLFNLMRLEGTSPNVVTLISSLKACSIAKAMYQGQELHEEAARAGLLHSDITVGNALVDLYTSCGSLARAQEVFDKLVVRDVISWNTLMSGYAKYEYAEEVIRCFKQMQLEGIFSDAITLVCVVKASGILGATYEWRKLHFWIANKGLLERDVVFGNALLGMYAASGFLEKAEQVFNQLLNRTVVSWTALIAGYAEHDHSSHALHYFEQMQLEGVFPNAVTFVCIIKACGSIEAIGKGQELHAKVGMLGLLKGNNNVGNSLVDMYARCGMLEKAQKVFDMLQHPDVTSWNALITGYTQNECGIEALACLKRMQLQGVTPDAVTFVCSLRACKSIGDIEEGANFESEIFRKGMLSDVIVANALVSFYCKLGSFLKARDLFNKLLVRDVVSWTVIMGGYVNQDQGIEALNCLEQMEAKGVIPDAITFVCSLKSCGIVAAIDKGKELHLKAARAGMLKNNLFVGSALVDMYLKCGRPAEAQVVFDTLLVRDVVSWTSLLAGYLDRESFVEALDTFAQMQFEGIFPDTVTYMCALKACRVLGAIERGTEIHVDITGKGLLVKDHPTLSNAVVSMYAKWGFLLNTQEAFNKLSVQDVNSGNASILGYTRQREVEHVFYTIHRMKAESETRNLSSFIGVLNTCDRSGTVSKGNTSLTLKQYTGMMDLINNTGDLGRGAAILRMTPFHTDLAIWQALLNACRKWGDVGLGEIAFKQALLSGTRPCPIMADRHLDPDIPFMQN